MMRPPRPPRDRRPNPSAPGKAGRIWALAASPMNREKAMSPARPVIASPRFARWRTPGKGFSRCSIQQRALARSSYRKSCPAKAGWKPAFGDNDATTKTLSIHGDFEFAMHDLMADTHAYLDSGAVEAIVEEIGGGGGPPRKGGRGEKPGGEKMLPLHPP